MKSKDLGEVRPLPPAELLESVHDVFAPAEDVSLWIRSTFIEPGGRLFNEDHQHLDSASIGVLWTTKHQAKQMRDVLAQAEKPQFQGNTWTKGRQEAQFMRWFGEIPDFVLTFYAPHAAVCSDIEWCAIVEHELYHCAQAKDVLGAPRINKQTGLPVFAMCGHDVEEFVGVVRRYGAMGSVNDMVAAALSEPSVALADISSVCGTCGR